MEDRAPAVGWRSARFGPPSPEPRRLVEQSPMAQHAVSSPDSGVAALAFVARLGWLSIMMLS
jgi:hypothetical protein